MATFCFNEISKHLDIDIHEILMDRSTVHCEHRIDEAQRMSIVEHVSLCTTTPYLTISSQENGVYMHRDWLIEKSVDKPAARLHRIMRSDSERDCLHNHPWVNCSVILEGEYFEIIPSDNGETDLSEIPGHLCDVIEYNEPVKALRRKVGDVVIRSNNERHRIIVDPANKPLSLFMVGPKIDEWGFFKNGEFIHHVDFLKSEDSSAPQ